MGTGHGVIAVLEEERNGFWYPTDARLIVIGDWPRVNGFPGPGGGVISIFSTLGGPRQRSAYLDVRLGPPAAIRLGAAWRISPTNSGELGELRSYTNFTSVPTSLAVLSTNFSVEVRPVSGFVLPPTRQLTLSKGVTTVLDLNYSVVPPQMSYHRLNGLGIIGTLGTAYRIETVPVLPFQSPVPLPGSVLLNPGVNWIPGTTPTGGSNRFHRAVWLPE